MIIPITHKSLGTKDLYIDDEDYDLIKNFNWRLNITSNKYTPYVIAVIYKDCKYVKTTQIHRLIMGLGQYKDDKRIVNHINGNGLDNRKCNLEICSHMYNSQSINKPHQKFGIVYYDNSMKRKKRWRYSVKIFGKSYSKRFENKEECIKQLCLLELKEGKKKSK